MLQAKFLSSISDIEPESWDCLFESGNPFIRHAFLQALEHSGCVSTEAGWQPQHLVLQASDNIVAAMPLYLKSHSYGEFVFDWGWAEAYERHGLDYYPKLLTAIPFTPSTGPRLGVAKCRDMALMVSVCLDAVMQHAQDSNCSGWHLLFPDTPNAQAFEKAGGDDVLQRRDVQFHWFNQDYMNFADFLFELRSSRRKNLRRERRLVAEQGVSIQRKTGSEITDRDWAAFYLCYTTTYLKRSGHTGYLNRDFFDRIRQVLGDQLMLVVAEQEGQIIASALFLFDSEKLYGRYWGGLADIRCLHFEACLYQGIEFCIERGIKSFDPGTQGEHKLLRGFQPIETVSQHWIADAQFRSAIAEYLEREGQGMESYRQQAQAFLPFRRGEASPPISDGGK